MQGDVLVRSEGGGWSLPTGVGYLDEAELQTMLVAQPSLVPGVSRGAMAVREFSTAVGPVDVVVLDEDGSLTIVECKLASNVQIRREIVGQVLDYASYLWQMPVDEFIERWSRRGGPALGDHVTGATREQLAAALDAGAFTVVLAVDTINPNLRRIVEYLNEHTADELRVVALELRRARHGDVDLLIPASFGADAAQRKTETSTPGASRGTRWAVADVMDAVAAERTETADALALLLEATASMGAAVVGTKASSPSLVVRLGLDDGDIWPLAVYTGPPRPTLQVNFQWISSAGEQARQSFLDHLAGVPGIDAAAIREAAFQRRPNVDLRVLEDPAVREALLAGLAVLRADGPRDAEAVPPP